MADEPPKRENPIRIRIAPESFSDIIFGLALSIGSLTLIQNQVSTWQGFVWNVMVFGFSFIIIALTWLLFSRTISVLSTEPPAVLCLNMALFFCVALEPYLFYLIMNPQTQDLISFTSIGYALDVGFMFTILGTLASFILKQEKLRLSAHVESQYPINTQRFKHARIVEYIVAALFFVSAAPIFWTPSPFGMLRFVCWYSTFFVALIIHLFARLKRRKPKS